MPEGPGQAWSDIPYDPFEAERRRLPGTAPVGPEGWLVVDGAYAQQMAERDRLIAARPGDVHRLSAEAAEPAAELLDLVLANLRHREGFVFGRSDIRRPDGVRVLRDLSPLLLLGRLVQADFCLLQAAGGVHRFTGAILCFPASWSLAAKFGRGLAEIHLPVAAYTPELARRVERLCAGVQPGRPLWRANALRYADHALFQPEPRGAHLEAASAPWLRTERQCLVRLPRTRAVAFSIHTRVLAVARGKSARTG